MAGWHPTTPLAHAVHLAGFDYDASQDILVSRMDAPLQSRAGFNWGYDEASAELLMILDCEPFYFTYKGRKWLIELWKGQYGLETGAEIGVYNAVDRTAQLAAADRATAGSAKAPRLSSARAATHEMIHEAARLYRDPSTGHYAKTTDLLSMSFTLRQKNNNVLVRRAERHWWLTGFKWGVFTRNTRDLTMDIDITLLDADMYESFRVAVVQRGYRVTDKSNLTLGFTFVNPKIPQPRSRTRLEDQVQAKNERLVENYCALRSELKLPSNDPNGFDVLTVGTFVAHKAAQRIVETAKTIKHDLPIAAKNLPHAADVVRKLEHELSGGSRTAYGNVLRFFEKGWRSSVSVDV